MEPGRCEFVYDPPGRPPPGAGPDGRWRCPRNVADGRDRCPFHLSPERRPAEFDAESAVREIVAADGAVRLYGTHLDGVDLQGIRLTPDGPGADPGLRLDGARIDGSVRLVGSVVDGAVSLRRAAVTGDVDAADAAATDLALDGARIDGDLSADDAELDRLGLALATVGGDASLVGVAVESATLADTEVVGDLRADDAAIGRANLSGVAVGGVVALRGATLPDGVDLRWLVDGPGPADDDPPALAGLRAREADLSGAALPGADLQGAELSRATLREADLRDAGLERASLADADLWAASLAGADAPVVDLAGADCREADLSGATLDDATLEGADLRNASLAGAGIYGATFDGARFDARTRFDPTTRYDEDAEAVPVDRDDDEGDGTAGDGDPDGAVTPLDRAIWSHWKIHTLLTERGLYDQATDQCHHLTELRYRARRARRRGRSARWAKHRGTLTLLRIGERPRALLAAAVAAVALCALLYPVVGLRGPDAVYRYRLGLPTTEAVVAVLRFSVVQFLDGFLSVPAALFGGFVPEGTLPAPGPGAEATGLGRRLRSIERLAGLAFSLPVGAAALRRVLLYSRSRADAESYGGLVAWLLGR